MEEMKEIEEKEEKMSILDFIYERPITSIILLNILVSGISTTIIAAIKKNN